VILSFTTKVLNLSDQFPGTRGHYECLLQERHWAVSHNKGKKDKERKSLLTYQLYASDSTAADDTADSSTPASTLSTVKLAPSPMLECMRKDTMVHTENDCEPTVAHGSFFNRVHDDF